MAPVDPTPQRGGLDALLESPEPSIRYKLRVGVLNEAPDSPGIRALREEVRESPRVRALLAGRDDSGRWPGRSVYKKWQGAHWVLVALADLGYPPGDVALAPLRDQVQQTWLAPHYFVEYQQDGPSGGRRRGVPIIAGRHRRCASQQGNALYAIHALGLADEATERLAERLLRWQWPDGGWNCDRRPSADTSSFMETLTPLRGLVAHAAAGQGDAQVQAAIARAAEVFLSRRLYRRRSDGATIHPDFVELHYPLYWRYDVLGGLKVMAEAGLLGDERCGDALDLLERKRRSDGGFPAEGRYYRTSSSPATSNGEPVEWGIVDPRASNPWVTADALVVLAAAARATSAP
jgi:hypothetical protein